MLLSPACILELNVPGIFGKKISQEVLIATRWPGACIFTQLSRCLCSQVLYVRSTLHGTRCMYGTCDIITWYRVYAKSVTRPVRVRTDGLVIRERRIDGTTQSGYTLSNSQQTSHCLTFRIEEEDSGSRSGRWTYRLLAKEDRPYSLNEIINRLRGHIHRPIKIQRNAVRRIILLMYCNSQGGVLLQLDRPRRSLVIRFCCWTTSSHLYCPSCALLAAATWFPQALTESA